MPVDLLPGSSIQPNTITSTQMSSDAWAQVYAALATANAAYAQANQAYSSANSASSTANNVSGGVSLGLVIALS